MSVFDECSMEYILDQHYKVFGFYGKEMFVCRFKQTRANENDYSVDLIWKHFTIAKRCRESHFHWLLICVASHITYFNCTPTFEYIHIIVPVQCALLAHTFCFRAFKHFRTLQKVQSTFKNVFAWTFQEIIWNCRCYSAASQLLRCKCNRVLSWCENFTLTTSVAQSGRMHRVSQNTEQRFN